MAYRVTFIPGDGVGPELSEATRRVLEATGVEFDWDVQEAGADVMDKYGTPLPEHVLAHCARSSTCTAAFGRASPTRASARATRTSTS